MISAFDIFKPGIGPSSSHTVGPMNAGKRFIDQLVNMGDIAHITRIVVDLYGSLSLTGKGHATDVAIVMGLAGNSPQNVDIDAMPAFIQQVMHSGRLPVANGVQSVDFQMADDIVFHAQTFRITKTGCVLPPGVARRRGRARPTIRSAAVLSSKRGPAGERRMPTSRCPMIFAPPATAAALRTQRPVGLRTDAAKRAGAAQ